MARVFNQFTSILANFSPRAHSIQRSAFFVRRGDAEAIDAF